jgi:hypothetical protein
LLDDPETAFDKFVRDVDENYVYAFLGNFLCDTATHVAGTNDTDFIDL